MKFTKVLASCPVLLLFLISVSFFPKCNGKSRAAPYPYRRYVAPSSPNPWRGYGGTAGGVLGGIGGEIGDLSSLSYRSSRKADQAWPFYPTAPSTGADPRSAREISYWNSYKPSYSCDFTCDDGTCLKQENRCDGYAQCWDGSDEKGCKCQDIIGEAKICDGYKDCPEGEDEQDCVYGCQSNEFTCDTHNSGSRVRCVAMSKRCDGTSDCPQGNDEHNCFRMVDLFDDETRGVMSRGILQKRLGDNEWHTVCKTSGTTKHVTQFAEKACQQIIGHVDGTIQVTTKSLSQMKLQMTKTQVQQLKYIRLAEIEAKFAVLGQCASDLVYEVECPSPQCGGHGNYEMYLGNRRRRRRDAEDDLHDEKKEGKDEEDEDVFGLFDEEDDVGDQVELIVGGYATEEMQWPFLVGIFRDGEFYCGGSIINDEWILTAAHCCHGYDKHVFEVQAGMTRRLSWSPYEQSRMVEEIFVHEEYNSKVFANDIALYKLDKPLHLSKYVTPACLPSGPADDPVGGQGCKVAGWGDLSESGSGPDHMQEVELPILSKCKETFTRDTYQICAGYTEGGKDACQGDSGGPLMCYNSAGKPIVNGVVSFGRGCARAHEAGAYTRVSAYLDWIEKVIAGEVTHNAYFPRPKQCTEKCFKPGGECIYPEEKCSGKVDCLGAEDEMGCTHVVTRNHDYATAPAYWPSYSSASSPPQQTYYSLPQQPQYGSGMVSRAKQSQPTTSYYPALLYVPPPTPAPPQQSMYSYSNLLSRGSNRSIRKVFGQCTPSAEFQCISKAERTHLTECVQQTKQCDRSFHCTDHSDELDCLTVTTNFREPVSPSSLMQMSEVKGYVLTRFQGNEWHPLVSKSWTLAMGQQMCQVLMGSESAILKSLESISMQELATRLQRQTGLNIMQGMAVTMDTDANDMMDSAGTLASLNNKMFGHPAQMSKIDLSNAATSSSTSAHLNEGMNALMIGFVRCSAH